MVRLLIFGDSITAGAFDNQGDWANRLISSLFEKVLTDKNFYGFGYNLSISGDTSEDLLERFEFETKQRLKETEETMFIISIGNNDSQFINAKNKIRTEPGKFKQNIQTLIKLARKYSSKIAFLGLLPINDTKLDPIPWSRDRSYKNEYGKKFNDIVKNVCQENNVYFIDIFDKLIDSDYMNNLFDGAHPNTQGHKIIFEIVKDFLIENKLLEE